MAFIQFTSVCNFYLDCEHSLFCLKIYGEEHNKLSEPRVACALEGYSQLVASMPAHATSLLAHATRIQWNLDLTNLILHLL